MAADEALDETSDDTTRDKAQFRTKLIAIRRTRSAGELEAARAAIRRHVLERIASVNEVAAYVPLRTEPGSVELLADLHAHGAGVLVPITLHDRDLDWAPWSPGGVGDPLGVDAISAAGLVLVPALAVAVDGTRLGRGGGSFDRALDRCSPQAQVAALVFDDEVLPWLPSDPWDVPVPAALTPSGWVELAGNAEVPNPG